MKNNNEITVSVSKTVQERDYEPITCSLTWKREIPGEHTEEQRNKVFKSMFTNLSEQVDELLSSRMGKPVRRR
jgi:hypothetical protein